MSDVRRTNLRVLAARPGRFEHHLLVVARAGGAQLEMATASEPLYFAHVNVSDEYAMALPTGDETVDRFPMRTFVTDAGTLEDVARYNHRVGDLVLHPLGFLHWPGRLRPPFTPFVFPPGMRRCGVSLVFCASSPTPGGGGPLGVTTGREADAKSYAANAPPLVLREVGREGEGALARVGDASLMLVMRPHAITAPRGAYVLVLEVDEGSPHVTCDLIHVPPGATLDGTGIVRGLVFASEMHAAEAPPASWDRLPSAPMAPFEDAPRRPLPLSGRGIAVTSLDEQRVTVAVGGRSTIVPRHWLARMLFRIALHPPVLGYVETYGGFFYDDRAPEAVRIGLRDGGEVVLPHAEAMHLVEALYRAVPPEGYREREGTGT
jgi:hypothetical protein